MKKIKGKQSHFWLQEGHLYHCKRMQSDSYKISRLVWEVHNLLKLSYSKICHWFFSTDKSHSYLINMALLLTKLYYHNLHNKFNNFFLHDRNLKVKRIKYSSFPLILFICIWMEYFKLKSICLKNQLLFCVLQCPILFQKMFLHIKLLLLNSWVYN